MCGIGGVLSRGDALVKPEDLRLMAERMRHRGPDARGFATFSPGSCLETARQTHALKPAHAGLVHLRLSIIDTSDAGWQPMCSASGRYAIVFNGEIYNYLELRSELRQLGQHFTSASDTEVLLAAWDVWGPACLPKLVGMFAFAILDTHANTLTLARDAFGIKPLFYVASSTFAFASELKALMPFVRGARRVDASRVFKYLRSGLTDDGDATMLAAVRQVPAGHWGTVDLMSAAPPTFKPFWTPSRHSTLDISFDEAVDRTRELFTNSVRLHLRSDVPVGACLSGGLDSSAIVSLMRAVAGDDLDLHTFTFVADSERDSEEHWATLAGNHVCAAQHRVKPNSSELVQDLETLIDTQDEPFASTSIYAQHRVFGLAAEHGIKVVLDGQGADELLGGYASHAGARLASLIRQGKFGAAVRFWQQTPADYGGGTGGRFFAAQYLLPTTLATGLRRIVGRSATPSWLNVDWFHDRGAMHLSVGPNASGDLVDELVADVQRGLPALLRYEDRNSMHFSIESRVPFLTPELCDFFLSLPESFLISDDGVSKCVLRAAMRGIVPDAILDRRDKVGFRTPERDWLRSAQPWAERILRSDVARALPVFHHRELLNAWESALRRPAEYNTWVWRWINFIRWAEINDVKL